MSVKPDQMLSHYRLIEKIGEGGMGVVWKALDTNLNRHVAIKVLPPELTADPERRLRFQREAQAAAALDHPNIAVIHEVGEDEGTQFLVMQLLEGKTLRERIRHRPLPLREWFRVALPVAEGLAHAHQHGIVHRDLKPDNVFITGEHQVKILDFGLAKLLEPDTLKHDPARDLHSRLETISRELTRAGRVFGTVAYMSPEQARGERVDHRSDLFSFGVLLYQMASGRLPFTGKTEVDTLSSIIRDEPNPLSEVAGEIPAEAERVVRKAMEKEPDRRYQHADELATDLRNLQQDLDTGRTSIPSRETLRRRGRSTILKWYVPAGVLAAVAVVFGYFTFRPGEKEVRIPGERAPVAVDITPGRKMIAVLPFENLGPTEDEYFAAGMTEEITSRLAVVSGLGVISRKSAIQYANTDKTTRQVGEELGVDYLLEGTVRWARGPEGGSRVRITPQLIRISDDTHVWSDRYDRKIEDIFEVQSEIARQVVGQLDITLLQPERKTLEARPTENLEAYQAYLQGMEILEGSNYSLQSDIFVAVARFEKAVSLDPDFSLAWAALSKAHSELYHTRKDLTEERLAKAREAADRALRLDPGSPESHMALGYYYYWGRKDYDRALQELSIASEHQANDSDILETMAFIWRRQGRFEDALANLEKAYRINPLDTQLIGELANTYGNLRRYLEADRYADLMISLVPDSDIAYVTKADNWLNWRGDPQGAREILEQMPKSEEPLLGFFWAYLDLLNRDYQESLERLAAIPLDVLDVQIFYLPKDLWVGLTHHLLGEPEKARSSCESARETLEEKVKSHPRDPRIRSSLGQAYACLGRKEDAIREAKLVVDIYPISYDALGGTTFEINLAEVYTMVGDFDEALNKLEYLLSIPAGISVGRLKTEPVWDPLRGNPRFQEFVGRNK